MLVSRLNLKASFAVRSKWMAKFGITTMGLYDNYDVTMQNSDITIFFLVLCEK
jgi:hypothetical protein